MGIVLKLAETVAVTSLASIYAAVAWNWQALPQRIPTHFNIQGQADKWGGKDTLILFCLIAAGVFIMLSLVQRRPQWMNIPFTVDLNDGEIRRLLQELACVLKASVMLILLLVVWTSIEVASGSANTLSAVLLPLAILLPTAPTIFYLSRLRRP